ALLSSQLIGTLHAPVVVLQVLQLSQVGQIWTNPDCEPLDCPPLSHVASFVLKPVTTSTWVGVPSESAPEVGSRLSGFTWKWRAQAAPSAGTPAGNWTVFTGGVKVTEFPDTLTPNVSEPHVVPDAVSEPGTKDMMSP